MSVSQNEYYDAFISYKHETGFYMANLVYEKLIYNGYSVFMDKNMRVGEPDFESRIENAIKNSRYFILVLFPDDLSETDEKENFICKEIRWALESEIIKFIPVRCDDYYPNADSLPEKLRRVVTTQGLKIKKDYSFDKSLDELCDICLKNANPVKPMINTKDFFANNVFNRPDVKVKRIDLAFQGGGTWRYASVNKPILDGILSRNIPVRILINTPKAAEIIAVNMRDDDSKYDSFEDLVESWKKYQSNHSDLVEVRKCDVPLLRVYHSIEYDHEGNSNLGMYDRLHVKYYVYNNFSLDKAFEHEFSSVSNYYSLYKNEFEYLWKQSEPI